MQPARKRAPRGGTAVARQADRRPGLHGLVRGLAAELVAGGPHLNLPQQLTARLTELLPVRHVALTTLPESTALRAGQPVRTPDYAAFAVPLGVSGPATVLEAAVDEERTLDDWTCQLLETAASLATLLFEAERLARRPSPDVDRRRDGAAPLIGSSPVMVALRERIERVATTDFTVLIEGESGTGKELVARQVHELGRRRQGPFVAINCAALVETLIEAELFGIEERTATGVRGRQGKFEHADGGTLFLDEVAELSLTAQAKLLRAIQDLRVERVGGRGGRRVDTRIVAATNRSLGVLVEKGLFRADLFYRLSGVEVRVPPLRDRREDILELAVYFLSRYGGRSRSGFSAAAIDALVSYEWPGNVRELERMVEGVLATTDARQIALDDLPVALRGAYGEVLMPSVRVAATMRAWGSRYARLVLERHRGNKTQACRVLGISYHTLNAYLAYQPPRVPVSSAQGTPSPSAAAGDPSG